MKKILLKSVGYATLLIISLLSFSSCVGPGVWWDDPGPGWNSFNDQRLRGYWQLVQYNGYPVSGYNSNSFYFDGYGSGYYYYYNNGYPETEPIRYWCQDSYGGYTYYTINIQYKWSGSSQADYWFQGGNTLYMEWYEGGRRQTYLYVRSYNRPW